MMASSFLIVKAEKILGGRMGWGEFWAHPNYSLVSGHVTVNNCPWTRGGHHLMHLPTLATQGVQSDGVQVIHELQTPSEASEENGSNFSVLLSSIRLCFPWSWWCVLLKCDHSVYWNVYSAGPSVLHPQWGNRTYSAGQKLQKKSLVKLLILYGRGAPG